MVETQKDEVKKNVNHLIDFKTFEEANKTILSSLDSNCSKVFDTNKLNLSIPSDIMMQFENISRINALIAKQIAEPDSSSSGEIEHLNEQVDKTLKIPDLIIQQIQSLEEMNKNLVSDFQIPKITLDNIKEIHKKNIHQIQKANNAFEQIAKIDPHYLSSLDPILCLAFRWDGILESVAKSLDFGDTSWWDEFDSLPELKELYLLWKNNDKNEIDQFFNRWFSERQKINNLIGALHENELFRPRMHIIEKALLAHLDGHYELSIPILLSQIDGVFLEKCRRDASMCIDCGLGNASSKRIGERSRDYFCFDANNVSRNILRKDNDYICFFLDHILKTFETIRHDILHGIKIDYPEKDFSTKLIVSMINLSYSKC